MSAHDARLLRASLVLVWLGTAVVSVLDEQRAGRASWCGRNFVRNGEFIDATDISFFILFFKIVIY